MTKNQKNPKVETRVNCGFCVKAHAYLVGEKEGKYCYQCKKCGRYTLIDKKYL